MKQRRSFIRAENQKRRTSVAYRWKQTEQALSDIYIWWKIDRRVCVLCCVFLFFSFLFACFWFVYNRWSFRSMWIKWNNGWWKRRLCFRSPSKKRRKRNDVTADLWFETRSADTCSRLCFHSDHSFQVDSVSSSEILVHARTSPSCSKNVNDMDLWSIAG